MNAHTTGNEITDSTFDNVGLAVANTSGGYAIAVFESDALISDNVVTNSGAGVATNYVTSAANAPLVTIQRNNISGVIDGMNLSGLADGSLIGGATLADGNVIDVSGSEGIGIVLQYAVGQATVRFNTITAAGSGSGIWLYHNEDPTKPVLVLDNQFTATGSTNASAGEGTGILLTDDGDLFGDEDGDSYATIEGNTISGFVRGVELYRNGNSPVIGRNVVATIGGTLASDNNTITGNGAAGSIGIRVFDANGTTVANAVANILNNSASMSGFAIGIDVDGGTAAVDNNTHHRQRHRHPRHQRRQPDLRYRELHHREHRGWHPHHRHGRQRRAGLQQRPVGQRWAGRQQPVGHDGQCRRELVRHEHSRGRRGRGQCQRRLQPVARRWYRHGRRRPGSREISASCT